MPVYKPGQVVAGRYLVRKVLGSAIPAWVIERDGTEYVISTAALARLDRAEIRSAR